MGDGGAAEESGQFLKRSEVEILRGDRAGHHTRNKMRLSFHPGASHLALLSFALLSSIPRPVTSYPYPPTTVLPTVGGSELESTLLHLQAALEEPGDVRSEAWAEWPRDIQPGEESEEDDGSWEEEALLRAQRGDLMVRPLSPFPEGHSLESMHYEEGGEGEDGWKRNDALTSIAGGLQAVSREKGGFGFRFGRKRWTDGEWMEGGEGEERRTSGTDEDGVSTGTRDESDERKKG
ncbi:uncharacterized protein qrfp [Oreochromis niloticus]|uniref:uncharacterized protein qrfp n=1 Tax=Oreochromis niloticus TaxID=8128 RepID=UPI00039423E5|nr:uncharacterized protein LOC102079317 [Oreochromis niloticus]